MFLSFSPSLLSSLPICPSARSRDTPALVYNAVTVFRRVGEFNDDNLMTTADTHVQRSDLLVTVY